MWYINSFSLNRALVAGEQLDFSGPPLAMQSGVAAGLQDGQGVSLSTDQACALFSEGFLGNASQGCTSLDDVSATCFRIWNH